MGDTASRDLVAGPSRCHDEFSHELPGAAWMLGGCAARCGYEVGQDTFRLIFSPTCFCSLHIFYCVKTIRMLGTAHLDPLQGDVDREAQRL